MGANVSKSTMTQVYNESIAVTNTIVNETANKLAVNNKSYQEIVVPITDSKLDCSTLTATNTIKSNLAALASMDATQQLEESNKMATEILAKMKTKVDQINTGISLGQANVNWFDSKAETNMKAEISNEINRKLQTLTKTDVGSKQIIEFPLDNSKLTAGGTGCTFTNSQVSKVFATSIVDSVLKASANTDIQNLAKVSQESTVSQKNEGILSFLTSPWSAFLYGGVFIILIIIIVVVVKKMKKNKK